ncbi:MAG: hypothetical protein J7J46_06285 [Candidatus Desulfofervidus sp.]|nr:hypothetical protein [Candidatus Desulfofervidus sp.]
MLKEKIMKILESSTGDLEEDAVKIENLVLSLIPHRELYDRDDVTNPDFATVCAFKDGWNSCVDEMMKGIENDE